MKNKKKTHRTYAKIAGKIKKVDFQHTKAKELPDVPASFEPGQDPIIKFKLDIERDQEIARRKDMEAGARIYVSWKNKMINRGKTTVGQILEALSDLASELDREITSEWKNWVINEIINPCIQKFHEYKIIRDYSQSVVVDCPECEWGGQALFHLPSWQEKKAEMTCPECGHRCTQEAGDMITEEEGRAIAARAKKEAKK
jgi:hypothetical protein